MACGVLALGCGDDDDDSQLVCEAPADGSCEFDGDCGDESRCAADRVADGEPITLACRSASGAPAGAMCERAEECEHALCSAAGVCVEPCYVDRHCDEDSRCASVIARTSDTTMHSLRACIPRASVTGASSFFDQAGGVDGLALEGGAALYVLVPSCDAVEQSVARLVETSTGTILYDRATNVRDNPVTTLGPPTALYLPSGSRPLMADEHTVHFPEDAPPHRVYRFGEPAGQTLDLDLFYVGLRDVPLAGPDISNAMAVVSATYRPAGITIGEVRHHLVVGEPERRFRIVDRELGELVELKEMASLSAATRTPSIAIYLVRSIDGALGASLGIPGPLGLAGSRASGIAIGAEVILDSSGSDLGRAIAHELGHFLGLFHTSEVNGAVREAFDDTEACTETDDTDGDGVLAVSECGGRGAENLMFWSARATQSNLSGEQSGLLRRAPILHE